MNNPLLYGFSLVALDVVVWCCVMPRNEVARLIVRLCIYTAFSALLFASNLSPFSQAPYADSWALHMLGQLLEIIWWLIGARLLSKMLDTFLLPKTWRRQRLFEDVFGALAFVAAIVASLGFVLELPIRGLVATSGALALVLGLAIQSTLSDVFAGIVINTTEPYEVGNWVSIDGVEGKVMEMNWRATHLLTSQGSVVIVPNAVAAKTKIINSSRPTTLHGVTVLLEVTPDARPKIVLDALDNALKNVRAALADPAPYAQVKAAGAESFKYEATAYVDDMNQKRTVSNELYDLCHRHLAAAGIELGSLGAPPAPVVLTGRDNERSKLLQRVDMFAVLTSDEIAQLAPHLSRRECEAGEVLITPESVSDSLTIIGSGVLRAAVKDGSGQVEVARLGPGETIGEGGLLAGLPSRETISTLTQSVLYTLKKDHLTPLLKNNPELAKAMCQLLSRRQRMLDQIGAPAPVIQSENTFLQWLLDGVRRLHDLTF